jgi:autotransporter-associated beta strand protein
MDRRIIAAVSGVVLGGITQIASAAGYASMISESGGTITFTLNEAADDVTIIRDGTPTSLGALGIGSHTIARSGAAAYSLRVSKTSGSGFLNPTALTAGIPGVADNTPSAVSLQISDDTNPRNAFTAPRGMTVQKNPALASTFGWVYVGNANSATSSGFPIAARSVGDGIYINGADGSDPTAQGDTALTNGVDFATGGNSSPYRLALDKDGFLYVADWADATGTVYRFNNNITAGGQLLAGNGSGTPLIPAPGQTHGSIAAVYPEGTSAAGNLTLFTIDEDAAATLAPTGQNGLWRFDIGNGTTSNNATVPTAVNLTYGQIDFVSQTMDMTRGPDGKFYITNFRSDGNEPGLFVLSPNGTPIYNSRADAIARNIDEDPTLTGINDPMRLTQGVDISPDGQYMAIMRNNSTVMMVPLIDGIPDLPNRTYVPVMDRINSGRDIAWDAAGNIYAVSSGNQALRIISPGKVSLTTYNSNGTFEYHDEPEWFVTGSGNSSGTGNWMLGYIPNGKSEIAMFGGAISAPATVTLDQATTLGVLKFNSTNKYTIAGTGPLTLDSFGEPRITVLKGSHDITAPVTANQNLQLTVIPAGQTLTVNSLALSDGAATVSLTKAGAGTAKVGGVNTYTGTTFVKGGSLVLVGATAWGPALISGGSLSNNHSDIQAGRLVFDYTTGVTPAALVLTELDAGYDATPKFSTGTLRSSTVTDNIGLGWKDDTIAKQVTVARTYYGDADLNGQVDVNDLGILATNWQTAKNWAGGDFDYNGSVDVNDLGLLATNWQAGVGNPLGPASLAAALESLGLPSVSVPEPACATLLAIGALAVARRRR